MLLGRGENSIFDIQQELRSRHPSLETVPVILDVRDRESMADVMKRHAPAVVFHAAAHKHVPLMEANVLEALRNNVLGTQSVVDASLAADVAHLVLISTDKAVRPTSVMGASKRIAEQIVQIAARDSGKAYVSVRFGNVLGSRGSVVPTFLRQIQSGGPVLITHPEMRRYFMTIPEAVQLVLQAFALGRKGEVFCLDMGEPVTILSLARDLIQLSGLEPYTDIDIQFTGARPGEKLYEEMFFGAEEALPTDHPKVLASRKAKLHPNAHAGIAALRRSLERGGCLDEHTLRATIRTLVEDFGTDGAPKVSKEILNGDARRPEVTTPTWTPRIAVDAGNLMKVHLPKQYFVSVALAILSIALPRLAQAQTVRPTPEQAATLLQTRPDLVQQLRQRMQDSGLTPEQIRARLKAEGYPENLLDSYMSGSRSTNGAAPTRDVFAAIRALGVTDSTDVDDLEKLAGLQNERRGAPNRARYRQQRATRYLVVNSEC